MRETANAILKDKERIHIIEPLEVLDFHNFLSRSHLIQTDSGGIQEGALSLGKPVRYGEALEAILADLFSRES